MPSSWRWALRHWRAVPRVVPQLALLVGLPGLVLAYFGLLSVRSEALAARAQFQERCESVARDVYNDVEVRFRSLEVPLLRTVDRFADDWVTDPTRAGDQLLSAWPDLLGLIVLDAASAVVYPPPDRILVRDTRLRGLVEADSSFMGDAFRRAERLEVVDNDPLAAADAYAHAIPTIPGDRGKAIAMNARARSLLKGRRPADARAAWDEVARAHGDAADLNSFPLGLLARYQMARASEMEGDLPEAATELAFLLRELTSSPWTYGGFAESVVGQQALAALAAPGLARALPLGQRLDLEGTRRVLQVLRRRQVQQALTLRLLQEGVAERAATGPRFLWVREAVGKTQVLLARIRWSGEGATRVFVVTLDEDRLVGPLKDRMAGAMRANPQITVSLSQVQAGPRPLRSPTEGVVYPLDPWMPGLVLSVARADPEEGVEVMERGRALRLGTIIAFTLLILLGTWVTARAVVREMEIAQMRTDFVSNVSHELRTPITTIRLMGEMLATGLVAAEEKRREYYATILSESERLSRLIDNVLDFARIEEGRKKFRFARGDLGECLRNVERITGDYARGEGFAFEVECAPDLPAVWFDTDAMVQALVNLVTNSVKYSRTHKHIRITAQRDMDRVVLRVRDRGEGIPTRDLQHIFEKFYRGGDTLTRDTRGAGLGLAIVKAIADAHGAEIRVDSRPGEGTTFSILLPVRDNPPATPA